MGWLISLGLLAAGVVWFIRTRQPGSSKRKGGVRGSTDANSLSSMRSSGQYWGLRVEVVDASSACEAVGEYRNKQLLINHAPELPLADCTSAVCRCHYVGLTERRTDDDRRVREDRREEIRFETDKGDRRKGNRRKSARWDKQHDL